LLVISTESYYDARIHKYKKIKNKKKAVIYRRHPFVVEKKDLDSIKNIYTCFHFNGHTPMTYT